MLSNIAAACCRTPRVPLLVHHTCKQLRVIRVLSVELKDMTSYTIVSVRLKQYSDRDTGISLNNESISIMNSP